MKKISGALKKRQQGRTRKTKIARKGLAVRRGEKGDARSYVTRNRALKRLQMTLKDFRRLCILKGIYPRDPSKKAHGKNKTYYYAKDIAFLAHEPILAKFRETKAFLKKVKRAVGRGRITDAKRFEAEHRPVYTLDHLVRERYPTFVDALRDLDDALCMVHLFATLPRMRAIGQGTTDTCLRLAREFQCYVARAHALRKCFLSVKGVYYEAEIMGQRVTWLAPFSFAQKLPDNVDYRVMLTFLEFYETTLRFVNFRLFHDLGLAYPPRFAEDCDVGAGFLEGLEVEAIGAAADAADAAKANAAAKGSSKISRRAAQELQGKVARVAAEIGSDDGGDSDDDEGDDDDDDDTASGAGRGRGGDLDGIAREFHDAEEIVELQRKNRAEAVCEELFKECVMFFSREVPRSAIELVARSFGARIGWDGAASPYKVDDDEVTHVITDREGKHLRKIEGRTYVQPQWIVDSANERVLLPTGSYAPGAELPPHLSPFVSDTSIGYTPDQRKRLDAIKERIARGDLVDPDATLESVVPDSAIEAAANSDMDTDDDDDDDDDDNDDAVDNRRVAGDYRGSISDSDDDDDDDGSDSAPGHRDSVDSDVGADDAAEAAYKAELESERRGGDADAAGRRALREASRKSKKKEEKSEKEATKMAKVMMSKRDRRLYGRIEHSERKKKAEADKLEKRRVAAKYRKEHGLSRDE